MKAWIVEGDQPTWTQVIFAADDDSQDRVEGEYGHAERRPEWDQYDGHIPAAVLRAAGWWFECSHCSHQIDVAGCEECEDLEGVKDDPTVCVGEDAYCSTACRDAEAERRRAYHERRAHIEREGRARVAERWPEAEVIRVDSLDSDMREYRVAFRVPWCKYPVCWEPACSIALVSHADVDAWRAHESQPGEKGVDDAPTA